MTIYTKPDLFEDMTPSLGGRLGESFGSGLSKGLRVLAENKFKEIERQQKAKDQKQKNLGGLPSAISKHTRDMGEDPFGFQEFQELNSIGEGFVEQGYPPDLAAIHARKIYDQKYPEDRKEIKHQQEDKYKKQINLGKLSSSISKHAKDMGRDSLGVEEFQEMNKIGEGFIEQGYPPDLAAKFALDAYDEKYPEDKKEPKTTLDYLKSAGEWASGGRELETPLDYLKVAGKFVPGVLYGLSGVADLADYAGEASEDFLKEKAFPWVKDHSLPWVKDQFNFQETDKSRDLYKRAVEKTKTATSINDFSDGEVISLTNKDIASIKDKELRKKVNIENKLLKTYKFIYTTLGQFPFFGKSIEERGRKSIDPDLATPPPVLDLTRLIGELLVTKGKSTLGTSAKAGIGYGGGGALNEFIRTVGTDEKADYSEAATTGAIMTILPKASEFFGKYFAKARDYLMKRTGVTKEVATKTILKEAESAGVSISKLEEGNVAEKIKFNNFLGKESETAGATASKSQKGLDPERVKPVDFLEKKEAATSKKVRSLKIARAETVEEATTRFSKESKELSKSSFDKYLEKVPDKPSVIARREDLEPKKIANEKELIVLKAKRKYLVESGARKENQAAIDIAEKEKYGIGFEVRHGYRPTMRTVMEKVEKAEANLVKDIIDPTAKSTKSVEKFNKTVNTYIDRAEDELVYSKNRIHLPDEPLKDYFQILNGKYLKMYKEQEKIVQKALLDPNSLISKSGKGEGILSKIRKNIDSSKTRLDVQMRKRKSLEGIKGAKGVFHRKWIDDIKGEQKLFNKNMIRTSKEITQAERKVTPVALKHMSKLEAHATRQSEKGAVQIAQKSEKEAVKEGAKVAQLPRVRSAEEAGRKAYNLNEDGLIEEATKHKVPKEKALSTYQTIAAMRNIPKNISKEARKELMRPLVKSLLKQARNQTATGFMIGTIESSWKAVSGEPMPPYWKYPIYASIGLPYSRGGGRPFIYVGMELPKIVFEKIPISNAKDRIIKLKGLDRQKEHERNKKRFGKIKAKEIISYKG